MRHRLIVILAVWMLAAAGGGCKRFDQQHYETIYIGQPAWDVRKVMGKPTRQDEDAWHYVHRKPPYSRAVIYFKRGTVSGKEWSFDPPPEP